MNTVAEPVSCLKPGCSVVVMYPLGLTSWVCSCPSVAPQVLASMDGQIQLYGAPVAVPSWTTLNSTADVGDTSIIVNGQVGLD